MRIKDDEKNFGEYGVPRERVALVHYVRPLAFASRCTQRWRVLTVPARDGLPVDRPPPFWCGGAKRASISRVAWDGPTPVVTAARCVAISSSYLLRSLI
ncbi:hypothetical protein MRX96_028645 [Rhipicephalus microplus]